jgi:hypothetical protein
VQGTQPAAGPKDTKVCVAAMELLALPMELLHQVLLCTQCKRALGRFSRASHFCQALVAGASAAWAVLLDGSLSGAVSAVGAREVVRRWETQSAASWTMRRLETPGPVPARFLQVRTFAVAID